MLYLDTDIIVLDKINNIDKTKKQAYHHIILKVDTDQYGFYNGGCVWTSVLNYLISGKI